LTEVCFPDNLNVISNMPWTGLLSGPRGIKMGSGARGSNSSQGGWLDPFRLATGLRSLVWVECSADGSDAFVMAVSSDLSSGILRPGDSLPNVGVAVAGLRAGEPVMINQDRAREMAVPYSVNPVHVWGAMMYPGSGGFLWADRDNDVIDELDFKAFLAFGRQFFSGSDRSQHDADVRNEALVAAIEGTRRILSADSEEECLLILAEASVHQSASRLSVVVFSDPSDAASCSVAAVAGFASQALVGQHVATHGSMIGLAMRTQMAVPADFRCGPGNRKVLGLEVDFQADVGDPLAVLPIMAGRTVLGALALVGGRFDDPVVIHGIRTLCDCAGLLCHQFRLRRRISEDAMRDGLTGMFNRRAFSDLFEQVYQSTTRHGTALSLLMIDADKFKSVNDELGHQAGDRVLQFISDTIRSSLRLSDFAGRYGGEEFIVCLPYTDIRGARTVAERIRMVCASTPVPLDQGSRVVTVSIGAATHRESESRSSELVKRADDALYRAKDGGRNRVELDSAGQ
jgi:diguanylate cyclase (GGDEF)-like protein